jgi:polyisoprenoid-binding protein YceI
MNRFQGHQAFWAGLFVFGALAPLQSADASENYDVDSVHSMVVFRIKHANVSYTYGRFNDPEGKFVFDESDPSKCSFEVTIKADKVDTNNEGRDRHLKSPDFLDARQYPTIKFKSTKIEAGGKKDVYKVTGDLTMHGVTKSISFELNHTGSGAGRGGKFLRGFEAFFTIKRTDFGMKEMLEGVGDDIKLMISLEGNRQ